MVSDAELLGAVPDFMSISTMLKAHPATEAGERIIYVEASREERDQQNEIVLQKALQDSVDHFVKFGQLDLDHKSMPTVAAKYGIPDPEAWAIGVPLAVRFDGNRTFVKAQLFSGDTPLAERANMVWDGLTKLNPPRRFYASVGGAVLGKAIKVDPATGERVAVVTKTRWNNLALATEPVCQHLESTATTVPIGAFAKSLGGFIVKGLTAGYGTDSATLSGGAALRRQSLHGAAGGRHPILGYFDLRERLAGDMRSGRVEKPGAASLIAHCVNQYGLSHDEAAAHVERFMRDLSKKRS